MGTRYLGILCGSPVPKRANKASRAIYRHLLQLTALFLVVGCFVGQLDRPANASPPQTDPSWTGPGNIGSGQPVKSISCLSAQFCVAVGQVQGGGATSVFDGHSWSPPVLIDSTAILTHVSCASPAFCVSSDYPGNVTVYNGVQWSTPATVAPGFNITGLSCPTVDYCVAVDVAGDTYIFGGTTWARGPSSSMGGVALSCTTTTFCMEFAWTGYMSIFDGTTWSPPVLADPLAGPVSEVTSVSCVSTSFCVAVDQGANVDVYNGSTWTETSIGAGPANSSVSCVSAQFCVVVDANGMRYSFDGTTWSPGVVLDPKTSLTAVSCPSSDFCVAADTASEVFYENYGSWTVSESFDNVPVQLSCVTATTFCMGLDGSGNLFSYDGTAWSPAGNVSETTLSCTSATFCMAMGNDRFQIFDGSTWTPVQLPKIGEGFDTSALSCVSSTFCVAVGSVANDTSSGTAMVFDGTNWSSPVDLDQNRLETLSCGSVTLCTAIDQFGNVLNFNGSSWSTASTLFPTGNRNNYAVSCAASFCIASGGFYWATFDGTSWGLPQYDVLVALQSISCVTSSFCVGVGSVSWGGNAWIYDGTSWSAPTEMDSAQMSYVSCASTISCVATDIYGGVRYLYQAATTTSGGPNQTTSTYGKPVTYSASVSGDATSLVGVPTRDVTFSVGLTTLCTAVVSSGTASCKAPNAPAGADSVSVTYSGDIHYVSSQASAPLSVSKAATNISGSFASSIAYGSENLAKFAVSVKFGTSLTPTGKVKVEATTSTGTTTTLCTTSLSSNATGTCHPSATKLAVGTYMIVAVYTGDPNFKSSRSTSATLVVR